MERIVKESIGEQPIDPRKIKEDYSVNHSLSDDKKKFGDVKNKIEVPVPELQMSFFVKKGTSKKEIEQKKQAYLNRSGAYLVFKAERNER